MAEKKLSWWELAIDRGLESFSGTLRTPDLGDKEHRKLLRQEIVREINEANPKKASSADQGRPLA